METVVAFGAHLFGLVGMAGVWLVPSRLWHLFVLRRIGTPLQRNSLSAALAITVLVAIACSVYVACGTLPRVFRCLWEGWCTAARGGGLFNLAMFGATVLLVEATWFSCRILSRRWSGNAA
jgi:hypothetical protein